MIVRSVGTDQERHAGPVRHGAGFYVITAGLLALLPVMSLAQSAGARDYMNTPVYDARFFVDLFSSQADTLAETNLTVPDNDGVVRTGVVSLLYSFPLGSQYGGVAISGGRSNVKIQTPGGKLQATGFTDPSVTFHANFFGAPALRSDEFAQATPQTYFSFHFTTSAPLGSYDRNSPVNVGSNRWTFTPLLNYDITWDEGVSWLDLYAGGRFFLDNNAYVGTSRLVQHPLYTLTAHYSRNIIGQKTWFSVGVYFDKGGESFIDGVPQHDASSGVRPSVGISHAFGQFRVTLRLDSTASKPLDVANNSTVVLRIGGPLF